MKAIIILAVAALSIGGLHATAPRPSSAKRRPAGPS